MFDVSVLTIVISSESRGKERKIYELQMILQELFANETLILSSQLTGTICTYVNRWPPWELQWLDADGPNEISSSVNKEATKYIQVPETRWKLVAVIWERRQTYEAAEFGTVYACYISNIVMSTRNVSLRRRWNPCMLRRLEKGKLLELRLQCKESIL